MILFAHVLFIFKDMFDSGMAEAKSGKIKIPLDKEACMVLLEYIYTGTRATLSYQNFRFS